MCIKSILPGQMLKDIILIYKPSLEETLGRPIGLILTRCWVLPEEIKYNPCKWMKWIRDVWERGAMIAWKFTAYLWVPL
jgi:hypothetical protein